jgi:DNA-binding GntR family transcriptional regulator
MNIEIDTELIKSLTDSELKTYCAIQIWRNGGKENMLPSDGWLIENTNKARATVYRALAGLKNKEII